MRFTRGAPTANRFLPLARRRSVTRTSAWLARREWLATVPVTRKGLPAATFAGACETALVTASAGRLGAAPAGTAAASAAVATSTNVRACPCTCFRMTHPLSHDYRAL